MRMSPNNNAVNSNGEIPSQGGAIVQLQDVHLTLVSAAGPVAILKGIDLAIAPGDTVSVVGPSGAGKSTMMMLMAGLERPSQGRIIVAGRDLTQLDEDGLALFRRDHIGIVFQAFHLIPTMTALENAAIPLELAGRRDAFQQAEAALVDVGLGHRLRHYPNQLSGGEQQRVALARALAPQPTLLLADEPTGNLDGHTGEQIMALLFDLCRRNGATLVLITHDMELAGRCRRQIHISDGQLSDLAAPSAPAREAAL